MNGTHVRQESNDFSKFQMARLMKRRNVQRSLDMAAKEMGGRMMTMNELEQMFREDGIVTDSLPGKRIAGDNVTRFVYISGKYARWREESEHLYWKNLRLPELWAQNIKFLCWLLRTLNSQFKRKWCFYLFQTGLVWGIFFLFCEVVPSRHPGTQVLWSVAPCMGSNPNFIQRQI